MGPKKHACVQRTIYLIYRKRDGLFFAREDKKEIFAFRPFPFGKIYAQYPKAKSMMDRIGDDTCALLPYVLTIQTIEAQDGTSN